VDEAGVEMKPWRQRHWAELGDEQTVFY